MSASRIDNIIAELKLKLTECRGDRDAAEVGSTLYQRRQLQADRVNYLKEGYSIARDTLVRLYEEFDKAQNDRTQYARTAADDTAAWSKLAAVLGVVGALMLVVGVRFDAPWWVPTLGGVFCFACAGAVFAALAAHGAVAPNEAVTSLAHRIDAIERACEGCTTEEALDALVSLLRPPDRHTTHEVARRTL